MEKTKDPLFATGVFTSASGSLGGFAMGTTLMPINKNGYVNIGETISEVHPFDDCTFAQPSFKKNEHYSSFTIKNNALSVHVEILNDPMSFGKIITIKYSLNSKFYQFNKEYSELEFKKVDRMHIYKLIVDDISEKIASETKIKLMEALAEEESKVKGAFFYE